MQPYPSYLYGPDSVAALFLNTVISSFFQKALCHDVKRSSTKGKKLFFFIGLFVTFKFLTPT